MSDALSISGIIRDGYSRPGYIAKVPYLHPALRFRFRPMLVAERDELIAASNRLTPQQLSAAMAKAVATRIIDWDLTHDGVPVERSAENVSRLQPNLFDRLFWIISGSQVSGGRNVSDVDPKWPNDERNSEADAALEAAINGTAAIEAKDAGN